MRAVFSPVCDMPRPGITPFECCCYILKKCLVMFSTFEDARMLTNQLVLGIPGNTLAGRVYVLDDPIRIGNEYRLGGLLNGGYQANPFFFGLLVFGNVDHYCQTLPCFRNGRNRYGNIL